MFLQVNDLYQAQKAPLADLVAAEDNYLNALKRHARDERAEDALYSRRPLPTLARVLGERISRVEGHLGNLIAASESQLAAMQEQLTVQQDALRALQVFNHNVRVSNWSCVHQCLGFLVLTMR